MNKRKDGGKGAASKSAGSARSGGLKAPGHALAPADAPTLALVRELALIATELDLAEIEVGPSGGVRVARRTAGGATAPAPASAHAPLTAPALAPATDEGSVFVTSPFVGTFYSAASPEAGPYTSVGQAVRKGQVVCIIEAMKLMNEIEAEADGKVADVLVKNGEHVEYGQKLFRLLKA
jgi:acetyl-CoA carboxylase biotin carboxyl carrier protein